jgi:4-hydroxy-3-methylbut-2-enyl diphosphate reductase IspH
MRDICKWHVEEFAYLIGKLKATPEGDGNVLDRTCLVYIHEHAEANSHKNNGLSVIVAGHAGKLQTGRHTRTTGTIGDLYLAAADHAVGASLSSFPTASREISGIFS